MSDDPKLHSAEWFRHQYRAMIEQMERWESQPGEGTRWSLLHPSLPPMPSGPHSLKWTERNWLAFCADCMLEKGRFLSGEFAHWCYECDGMAIDETCPEFQNCLCFSEVSVSEITQQLVAVVAEYDREIEALRAENERLRAEALIHERGRAEDARDHHGDMAVLRAENKALRQDAERYRHIRSNIDAVQALVGPDAVPRLVGGGLKELGRYCDECIDDVMRNSERVSDE